jgi:hypothetical protein
MLFAAALGVALGAGPLQDDLHDAFQREPEAGDLDSALARRHAELQSTVRFDTEAVSALAPTLLSGRLQGRPVVVLSLPGAADRQLAAVTADVEAAGGTGTSHQQVGADLIDPSARTLVDTLSAGQVKEYDDLTVPKDAGVYDRVGMVMARALVTRTDSGAPVDEGAASVLNGFTTAGLLTGEVPGQRASLALVVAGPEAGDADADTARGSIIATLARQLRGLSDGVVVAGPAGAAAPGGAVWATRDDAEAAAAVSTVDTLNTRLGSLGTVLALAEQARDASGHYGVNAPDGALPS